MPKSHVITDIEMIYNDMPELHVIININIVYCMSKS